METQYISPSVQKIYARSSQVATQSLLQGISTDKEWDAYIKNYSQKRQALLEKKEKVKQIILFIA